MTESQERDGSRRNAARIKALLLSSEARSRYDGIRLANDFIRDENPGALGLLQPLLACALYDADPRNRIEAANVYHLCTGDFASVVGVLSDLASGVHDLDLLASLADTYYHTVVVPPLMLLEPMLLDLIRCGTSEECWVAADHLTRHRDNEIKVAAAAKERLSVEKDKAATWKLLELLTSMRGQVHTCLPEILRLVTHEDSSVRSMVCHALGMLYLHPGSLDALIQLLVDPCLHVRLAAVTELGQAGTHWDEVFDRVGSMFDRLPEDIKEHLRKRCARWSRVCGTE
jgi:hypothetical protein